MRVRAVCGALSVCCAAGSAFAQTVDVPPTLSGEWGGVRTDLRAAGVDLTVGYTSETGWNFSGGDRQRVRDSGQLAVGATLDAEKLLGIAGGTFQATLTYRHGEELGPAAGLGLLQQALEVYGRGQTWRLTQVWYEQVFARGVADVKFGRMTVGEDFAVAPCDFMNLTFCGAQPGNIVGDYWYNWPVSQWGGLLRLKDDDRYVQVGMYEVNPRNLLRNVFDWWGRGATGVLIPIEFGMTPAVNGLPGEYRLGGWYDTSGGDDLALGAPLHRSGRYGMYVVAQQQLTGTADGANTTSGLTVSLRFSQADTRTALLDNQLTLGLTYMGAFAARPKDVIGFAVGRTHVNPRGQEFSPIPQALQPTAEYVGELYYGFNIAGWLTLRPNLQYVVHPGGLRQRGDVAVLGLKAAVAL